MLGRILSIKRTYTARNISRVQEGVSDFRENVLSPQRVGYFTAIKNKINPENRPITGVYPASGADAATFLLASNATTGVFIDQLSFDDPRHLLNRAIPLEDYKRGTGIGCSPIYLYLGNKVRSGGSVVLERILRMGPEQPGDYSKDVGVFQRHIRAPFLWELFALGVEKISITQPFLNFPNVYRIDFNWAHPEEKISKPRTIFFVSSTTLSGNEFRANGTYKQHSKFYLGSEKETPLTRLIGLPPLNGIIKDLDLYFEKGYPGSGYIDFVFRIYLNRLIKPGGQVIVNDNGDSYDFIRFLDSLPREDRKNYQKVDTSEIKGGGFGYGGLLILKKKAPAIGGHFKEKKATLMPIFEVKGKKVLMPEYDSAFFRNTEKITVEWLIDRMKEISQANSMSKEIVPDIIDHSEVDLAIAQKWAALAKKKGHMINEDMLKLFAYAHDMGRMAVGGIHPRFHENMPTPYHGAVGREIFLYFADGFNSAGRNDLADICTLLSGVCSGHTAGVGFTEDSNKALGILPHGEGVFKDDTVWTWFNEHPTLSRYYKERLLLSVADAVSMYPRHTFKFWAYTDNEYGDTVSWKRNQITLNGKYIAGHREEKDRSMSRAAPVHALLIDPLTSSIKTRNPDLNDPAVLSEISGFNIGDTMEIKFLKDKPYEKGDIYQQYISVQTFSIKRTGKRSISIKVTGPEGKEEVHNMDNVDSIYMHNGEIRVNEIVKASRTMVHARYDHFSPRNHANISRAFEEVVELAGEENRAEVEIGWEDLEKLPK